MNIKNIGFTLFITLLISFFSLGCFQYPSDNELEVSIFDIPPDISKLVSILDQGDSFLIIIDYISLPYEMEFAYNIKLSDYEGFIQYSDFKTYNKLKKNDTTNSTLDTIIVRKLSETLERQFWDISVRGRFVGNVTIEDTVHSYVFINDISQGMQLSPSVLTVAPILEQEFYIDVILDDIEDSILAGDMILNYDTTFLKLDTITFQLEDSTHYFNKGNGELITFIENDTVNYNDTITFGFINGVEASGLNGSGKLVRLHFSVPPVIVDTNTSISLLSGKLKDINNGDVSVSLSDANINILAQGN